MNKNCFAPLAFAQSATGLSHQDQKLTLVLCKEEGVRTRLNTKNWQIGILVYHQSPRTIMDTKSLLSHTLSCSTFVARFSRFVSNRQRERGVVFLHLLLPEVCKISIVERRKRENNILDNLQRLAIVVKNYIEG
jgi:hypothetical protein